MFKQLPWICWRVWSWMRGFSPRALPCKCRCFPAGWRQKKQANWQNTDFSQPQDPQAGHPFRWIPIAFPFGFDFTLSELSYLLSSWRILIFSQACSAAPRNRGRIGVALSKQDMPKLHSCWHFGDQKKLDVRAREVLNCWNFGANWPMFGWQRPEFLGCLCPPHSDSSDELAYVFWWDPHFSRWNFKFVCCR